MTTLTTHNFRTIIDMTHDLRAKIIMTTFIQYIKLIKIQHSTLQSSRSSFFYLN